MHPFLRVVLVIVGAATGANLGTEGIHFLAALVGALAGLAISEVIHIRSAFANLRTELRDLRALIERATTSTLLRAGALTGACAASEAGSARCRPAAGAAHTVT